MRSSTLNTTTKHWRSYDKALDIEPDLAEAHLGRGNAFSRSQTASTRHSRISTKRLILKPELTDAEAARLYAKMNLCDWKDLNAECERLMASERSYR